MTRYNSEANIYDTIYEHRYITIEYDFTSSELDYFEGTGTFDGVTINRILEDNLDITNNFTQEDLEFLRDQIFEYHINK